MNRPTSDTPRRAAIAWSGGKDSLLALLNAREQGWAVEAFVTMCEAQADGTPGDSLSHRVPVPLLAEQARRLGGTLWPQAVPSGRYGEVLDAALAALVAQGVQAMVFGDIDLAAHRDWIEPRCAAAGVQAVFPLWGRARAELAAEALRRGLRAQLVCVDERWLDASFCGAEWDEALLARMPRGVCPMGEEGEFHTLAWGGQGFSAPLRLVQAHQERVATVPPWQPTHHVFQRFDVAATLAASEATVSEPQGQG